VLGGAIYGGVLPGGWLEEPVAGGSADANVDLYGAVVYGAVVYESEEPQPATAHDVAGFEPPALTGVREAIDEDNELLELLAVAMVLMEG
jgi:hypothetical protein